LFGELIPASQILGKDGALSPISCEKSAREEGAAERSAQSGTAAEEMPPLQEVRDEGRLRRQKSNVLEGRAPQ
jgi:hypothetical protein